MNLQEQYKRLFKGKPMSNDASIINEDSVAVYNHYKDSNGNTIFTGRLDLDKSKVGKEFDVVAASPNRKEWKYYLDDFNKLDTSGKVETDVTPAIDKYIEDVNLDPKEFGNVGQELELDDPISVTFDRPGRIDAPTEMGSENLPIDSITLHFWGGYINLNAVVDGAMDYYGDDDFLSQLIDMIPKLESKPDYKEWIQEIESMGGPSANEIEKGLAQVEYTESGMNEDGDVSTEYYF